MALSCISCTAHAQSPSPDARTLDTVEVVGRAQSLSRFPGSAADASVLAGWRLRDARWSAAVEARASDAIMVDDRNSDATEGYALLALRLEWKPQRRGGWRTFLRVDNLFDREYVGSVIVNEGNGRYFEPGAGRSPTLGIGYGR